MKIRANTVLALLCAAAFASQAQAQNIADSSIDFSDEQGINGWTYGFYDGDGPRSWGMDDFELLTFFDGLWRRMAPGPDSYWTAIGRMGGHPNSTVTSSGRIPEENWAVRRWTAHEQFMGVIHGRIWDNDPTPNHGDGVIGSILFNDELIWTATIDNGNFAGIDYQIVHCIMPGDIIDFIIAPNANDFCDDTGFINAIRTVIERQPEDYVSCPDGPAEFSISTGVPSEFQWRFNGEAILNATEPTLTIPIVTPEMVGVYDCVVTVPDCGTTISEPANLTICSVDYNCDGVLNSQDFFDFLVHFLNNEMQADFNRNGVLNSQDYFDFLTAFFAGC
jgi:hypothetical protein